MLKDLPRQCDIGAKTNSKGHEQYRRGYKLHLDVADGQIPISAVLTSASVLTTSAAAQVALSQDKVCNDLRHWSPRLPFR